MGRHYSYILDPSISLMSHLMARVEQKERRSQLFAGSQLLLWWRPVYKSAAKSAARDPNMRLSLRRRWTSRDLSASLDAAHNFCRLNCAPAFCLFAMPCAASVIYGPGPYQATLGPVGPALVGEQ